MPKKMSGCCHGTSKRAVQLAYKKRVAKKNVEKRAAKKLKEASIEKRLPDSAGIFGPVEVRVSEFLDDEGKIDVTYTSLKLKKYSQGRTVIIFIDSGLKTMKEFGPVLKKIEEVQKRKLNLEIVISPCPDEKGRGGGSNARNSITPGTKTNFYVTVHKILKRIARQDSGVKLIFTSEREHRLIGVTAALDEKDNLKLVFVPNKVFKKNGEKVWADPNLLNWGLVFTEDGNYINPTFESIAGVLKDLPECYNGVLSDDINKNVVIVQRIKKLMVETGIGKSFFEDDRIVFQMADKDLCEKDPQDFDVAKEVDCKMFKYLTTEEVDLNLREDVCEVYVVSDVIKNDVDDVDKLVLLADVMEGFIDSRFKEGRYDSTKGSTRLSSDARAKCLEVVKAAAAEEAAAEPEIQSLANVSTELCG